MTAQELDASRDEGSALTAQLQQKEVEWQQKEARWQQEAATSKQAAVEEVARLQSSITALTDKLAVLTKSHDAAEYKRGMRNNGLIGLSALSTIQMASVITTTRSMEQQHPNNTNQKS